MGAGIFTTLLTNHRLIIIGVCVSFARVEKMGLNGFQRIHPASLCTHCLFLPLSPVCNQQGTRERKASPTTFEPGRLLPSAWGLETAGDRKGRQQVRRKNIGYRNTVKRCLLASGSIAHSTQCNGLLLRGSKGLWERCQNSRSCHELLR